jgi:dipeptidyl aminopeptidase/acylaminoacyl peptidase
MNIPVGTRPFPVVIVIHGYVPPDQYETLSYTTRYADALAEAGFLVIHPNLRGHFPSEDDAMEVFEQAGYAVDVLNLVAQVREQGGLPGALLTADPTQIGLWGHSMGGGITIRIITVDPAISAAVLYGSMNADERLNFERINTFWTNARDGGEELSTPPERLAAISPVNFLDRIATPVSIHHGAVDTDVPVDWSVDLCARLTTLQKSVECFYYEGQDHILWGEADVRFQQRVVDFFRLHLD